MKLAVICDEVSQDLRIVTSTARDLGFDGIEIRSFDGLAPSAQSASVLQKARRVIEDAGIAVAGYCPPALKCSLPRTDSEIKAAREDVQHAIEQAVWVGAPHVRIFSCYRNGEPAPASAAMMLREVLDGVERRLPLLLETGTRTNTPTIRHAESVLSALDGIIDGLLWDPGNGVFSGFITDSVDDEWVRGRNLIRHVHVKDPSGTKAYVRLGDGDIPWQRILRHMSQDSYNGWLSLETHWRIQGQLSRGLRDEPHGFAFSDGAYGASVECMQILRYWAGDL